MLYCFWSWIKCFGKHDRSSTRLKFFSWNVLTWTKRNNSLFWHPADDLTWHHISNTAIVGRCWRMSPQRITFWCQSSVCPFPSLNLLYHSWYHHQLVIFQLKPFAACNICKMHYKICSTSYKTWNKCQSSHAFVREHKIAVNGNLVSMSQTSEVWG